jgi:uncharacterized protein
MNEGAMQRPTELLPELTYDVCVLTGDYRGATFGPFDAAPRWPRAGTLASQGLGIRMLLNECERILRGDQAIYLAGIDDAHYYRVDNIERPHPKFPTMDSQSSCPIRRKSTGRPHMAVPICL